MLRLQICCGSPRDFKVREKFARATAAIIKRKHPDAEVMLRELETGEVTVIDQPSNLALSRAKPLGKELRPF